MSGKTNFYLSWEHPSWPVQELTSQGSVLLDSLSRKESLHYVFKTVSINLTKMCYTLNAEIQKFKVITLHQIK